MSATGKCSDSSTSEKLKNSKDLLISEYKNETDAEHVMDFLSRKPKVKPTMKHVNSSVLQRVKVLLPSLEQSEKELGSQDQSDYNIEEIGDSDSVIEMDVAIMKKFDDTDSSESEDDSDETLSNSSHPDCIEFENLCDSSDLEKLCDLKSTVEENKDLGKLKLLQTSSSEKRKRTLIEEIEITNEAENYNKAVL